MIFRLMMEKRYTFDFVIQQKFIPFFGICHVFSLCRVLSLSKFPQKRIQAGISYSTLARVRLDILGVQIYTKAVFLTAAI